MSIDKPKVYLISIYILLLVVGQLDLHNNLLNAIIYTLNLGLFLALCLTLDFDFSIMLAFITYLVHVLRDILLGLRISAFSNNINHLIRYISLSLIIGLVGRRKASAIKILILSFLSLMIVDSLLIRVISYLLPLISTNTSFNTPWISISDVAKYLLCSLSSLFFFYVYLILNIQSRQ